MHERQWAQRRGSTSTGHIRKKVGWRDWDLWILMLILMLMALHWFQSVSSLASLATCNVLCCELCMILVLGLAEVRRGPTRTRWQIEIVHWISASAYGCLISACRKHTQTQFHPTPTLFQQPRSHSNHLLYLLFLLLISTTSSIQFPPLHHLHRHFIYDSLQFKK